jgi:hypothetical protein
MADIIPFREHLVNPSNEQASPTRVIPTGSASAGWRVGNRERHLHNLRELFYTHTGNFQIKEIKLSHLRSTALIVRFRSGVDTLGDHQQ